MIVTSNVDHIVCLRRNAAFRAAYRSAFLVTADGMPVFLYARLRGAPVGERAPGSDLIAVLIDRFDRARHRPFFVCASLGVAEALNARLAVRGFAPGRAAFAAPPFGFEDDAAYSRDLAAPDSRARHDPPRPRRRRAEVRDLGAPPPPPDRQPATSCRSAPASNTRSV